MGLNPNLRHPGATGAGEDEGHAALSETANLSLASLTNDADFPEKGLLKETFVASAG